MVKSRSTHTPGPEVMHEMSIAQALLNLAMEEAQKHHLTRVTRLTVQVGEMAAVIPEVLSFSFSILTPHTLLEGATMEIEVVPIVAQCPHCHILFEVEHLNFRCPDCGVVSDTVLSGQELLLISIDGEKGVR